MDDQRREEVPSETAQAWDSARRVREPAAWALPALTAIGLLISAWELLAARYSACHRSRYHSRCHSRSSPANDLRAPGSGCGAAVRRGGIFLLPILSVILVAFAGGLTDRACPVVQTAISIQVITLGLGVLSWLSALGADAQPGIWFISPGKSHEDHQAATRAVTRRLRVAPQRFGRALRGELIRTLRSEISAVGAVMLTNFCLLAATGCAGDAGAKAAHAGANATLTGAENRPRTWALHAEAALAAHGKRAARAAGLYLESLSGRGYSGGAGFAAGPAAGSWPQGLGPAGSVFFYGPVPASAVMVRLTAPGQAPILVRTRPFPLRAGLPRGRFFITQPPGSAYVNWNVTPVRRLGSQNRLRGLLTRRLSFSATSASTAVILAEDQDAELDGNDGQE